MLQKYNEWKDRPPLTFDEIPDESILVPDGEMSKIEDDKKDKQRLCCLLWLVFPIDLLKST